MYIAARNGHREVAEILLGNGADVNAAMEVRAEEWRDLVSKNVCQDIRNRYGECGNDIGRADSMQPMVHGWG